MEIGQISDGKGKILTKRVYFHVQIFLSKNEFVADEKYGKPIACLSQTQEME
jgi:hypothetical protein